MEIPPDSLYRLYVVYVLEVSTVENFPSEREGNLLAGWYSCWSSPLELWSLHGCLEHLYSSRKKYRTCEPVDV